MLKGSTLGTPIRILLCLLLVVTISMQSGSAELGASVSQSVTPVHDYKVALDASTLWGTGNNTHSEMLDSASKHGFDAVFFTDEHYFLDNVGIEDPGFENVTASGSLQYWLNSTYGSPAIGMTRVNRTVTRTGSSSLEFALESSTNAEKSATPVRSAQSHQLHLFGNVHLTTSVYVANVTPGRIATIVVGNVTRCISQSRRPPVCKVVQETREFYSSEASVYSVVTLRLSPHANSTANIFFVYDYRYPIGAEPSRQNSTSVYYFYLKSPHPGWNDLSVNLTSLVKELWNQTVVDYGWIESVSVGVMSFKGAYVDALFDAVSITPVDEFAIMMQYLRDSIAPDISTDHAKAYSGYSLSRQSPAVSILGGNADAEDFGGVTDWDSFSLEIRDTGSLLVLDSPVPTGVHYALTDPSQEVKYLSVADLSTDQQLWDDLLSQGKTAMIAASGVSYGRAVFARQEDFANENIWVNHVLAATNSEQSLLESIYLGHSYVARNSFNGQFEFDSLDFQSGRLPFYVADAGDAIVHVKVSGVPGGTIHIISNQTKEIATEQLPLTGEFEETFRFSFDGNAAYFRTVVTNSTGSPVVLSNPMFYVHRPMPPGSYAYISDPAANIQSWNMTEIFTHREVSIRLGVGEPTFPVSGNGTVIYFRLPTRESRYQIRIANVVKPADDFYDNGLSGYVIPLSTGLPVTITLSLDKSVPEALADTGRGVLLLLMFAVVPVIIASAYLALNAFVKRRRKS